MKGCVPKPKSWEDVDAGSSEVEEKSILGSVEGIVLVGKDEPIRSLALFWLSGENWEKADSSCVSL